MTFSTPSPGADSPSSEPRLVKTQLHRGFISDFTGYFTVTKYRKQALSDSSQNASRPVGRSAGSGGGRERPRSLGGWSAQTFTPPRRFGWGRSRPLPDLYFSWN